MDFEISAIIQARLGSTRFPKKVLKNLYGKTILEHVIDNLLKSKYINNIVVATTQNYQDNEIEDLVKLKTSAKVFRGSELDVLSRYYNAAKSYNIKNIIRITSDNPIMDPLILDSCIEKFFEKKVDYLSTKGMPLGMGIEIFTFNALELAYLNADKEYEREHVTPFLYDANNKLNVTYYENDIDYSSFRLTVDTKEDYEVIKTIYEKLYENNSFFSLSSIVKYLNNNPQIVQINRNIQQKKLEE